MPRPRPGRRTRTLIALLVALSAGICSAAQPTREATRAALDEVVEKLNALNVWFSEAEKQRVRWLKDVQSKDREVAAVSQDVARAEAAVAGVRAELDKLEQERGRLQAQRREQAARVAEHLAAAYRLSGEDLFKQLLNQQSPEQFERMIRYHQYFSSARLESLAEYRTTLARLAENEAELQAQADERERRQAALRDRQRQLEKQRDERKQLLAELDAEVENRSEERKRLGADRERLESLLAELRKRAETLDGKAFAARKGKLAWPVEGRVRNAFGQPRAGGQLTWHGIVINVDEGTPINAVFSGRVVFADWLRGFGLLAIVDHGSGYMTLYGNAEALTRKVGDWVESGEPVARAGRSGGEARSGLYFEVRQNGEARDPIAWLERR
ncbi:MAG: peptidoglycan DD-metalloendopeptidase family protein [Pseudomonadales bacterium]